MKKLVLFLGYECNNHCGFCVHLHRRGEPSRPSPEVLAELADGRRRGFDYVELIGGEATIRPDFNPLVRCARGLGYREVALATNGRMFAYPAFAADAVAAGVTTVIFSVHGADADAHDAMTSSPGSFDQLVRGVENLQRLDFPRIFANSVVSRPNVDAVPEVARFLLRLGIRTAEFILVDPSGGALSAFERWVPPLAAAGEAMRRALAVGRGAGTEDFTVRYLPLCLAGRRLDQVSELREARVFSRVEHRAPGFVNADVQGSRRSLARVKTARCAGCGLNGLCEGIWKEYYERRGDEELRPVGEALHA